MIDEKRRIEEVLSYKILDASFKSELKDLTKIASLLLDAPISLISILDGSKQLFKAKIGPLEISSIDREFSFINYELDNKNEVFVVHDASNDSRFANNPYVTGTPHVRFYAGAPLVTPNNIVLGSLCVIDNKPRTITENQKEALKLLAKKAMEFLNTRKLVLEQKENLAISAKKLIKLTENIPSTIFQLRRTPDGKYIYDFLSLGKFNLPKEVSFEQLKKHPGLALKYIHPEYQPIFLDTLIKSYKNLSVWYCEYKLGYRDNCWFMVKARPELQENGDVVWYGIYQEITSHILYEETMEQIAFDISHVLRKPVSNLLSLAYLIEEEKDLNETQLKEYVDYIKVISSELDKFTKDLDSIYQNKWAFLLKNSEMSTFRMT